MLANKKLGAVFLIAAAGALGCGSSSDSSGGKDSGTDSGMVSCGVDPASTKESSSTGTVSGTVVVPTATMFSGGYNATGDLYIAIVDGFDAGKSCPGSSGAPKAVAQTLIRCADLQGGKPVNYEVHGVPPRAQAYKIVPFLDTNGNASTGATAGPDACDIISLGADVVVDTAGKTVTADVKVDLNGEILRSVCTSIPACAPKK